MLLSMSEITPEELAERAAELRRQLAALGEEHGRLKKSLDYYIEGVEILGEKRHDLHTDQ